MFFSLKTIHTFKIKIASYAKLPYVTYDRKYYKSDYEPYNQIHNTMYCVETDSLKTCFYIKNNEINYYRKRVYSQEIFILDTVSSNYKPIKFTKLDSGIDDKDTISIKTEKGKWYLITRYKRGVSKGQYIFIIDALSGTWLYKEEMTSDNNIYVDILYPVANRILPIIHVTRWNLYIKLFDVENESIHTMITINLEYIDNLVKLMVNNSERAVALKNNLSHYEIDYIESFSVVETKYLYDLFNKKVIYMRGVMCRFSLEVRYRLKQNHYYYETCRLNDLFCYIELDKEDVNCWLDLNKVKQNWADRHHYGTLKVNDTLSPVIHKYSVSNELSDIYLSTCLYKDKCYYVYNTSAGTGIIKVPESDYIELSPRQAALYCHEKYLIMFFYAARKMLVIIDTEHNRIGYWEFKHCNLYCQVEYIHYYSKIQNKLIFLSKHCLTLLIIDIDKLDFIFKSNKHSECIGNYEDDSNSKDNLYTILCCFDVNQLITEAIARAQHIKIELEEVQLISNYIDTSSDTLYISVAYVIHGKQHIGVFSLRMSCDNVNFKILHYSQMHYSQVGIPFNVLLNKSYQQLSLSKIFLYRFDLDQSVDKSGDLNIAYNRNMERLVSIRHNRNSIDVTLGRYTVLGKTVFSFKDLIAVTHIINHDGAKKLALLFIKSDLSLVRTMTDCSTVRG